MSPAQVKDVVRNLKVTYRGDNYHMLEQSSFVIELMYSNCNHFSNDLCKIIAGKEIPSYVNRCAKVASWFSGIVNAVADHMAVVTPGGGGDVQETSSKEQLSSPEGGNDSTFSRSDPGQNGIDQSHQSNNLRTDAERRPSHPTRKRSYLVFNKHITDVFPSPSALHSTHFPHVPLIAISLFVPLYLSFATDTLTLTRLLSVPSPLIERSDATSYVIVFLLSATPLMITTTIFHTYLHSFQKLEWVLEQFPQQPLE